VKYMSQQAPTGSSPAQVIVRFSAAFCPGMGDGIAVHAEDSGSIAKNVSCVRPTHASFPARTTPAVVLFTFAANTISRGIGIGGSNSCREITLVFGPVPSGGAKNLVVPGIGEDSQLSRSSKE
jgi:hypothetical protein